MELLDINKLMLNYNSYACAIPDPDLQRVIITGGWSLNTVSVYGVQGWIQDLEPLGQGRYQHACTSFLSDGERVKQNILLQCENNFYTLLDSDGYWRLWR